MPSLSARKNVSISTNAYIHTHITVDEKETVVMVKVNTIEKIERNHQFPISFLK